MPERKKINQIKAILNEQGRTQSWLAAKLGVNYNTANGWCNNRNQPHLAELLTIAELLEVAPADLIVDGRKKEKAPKSEAFL